MSRRGRFAVETRDDVLMVSGPIDESARLLELLDRSRDGRLVLDLGGVTFINSLGVRDWIRMQAAAHRTGVAIELRRVAEPVIHQLNMIIATRGARISSFFAPYACDGCGREESMLIDAIAHGQSLAELSPPAMTCVECGSQMVF